jgi:hypothetical protein
LDFAWHWGQVPPHAQRAMVGRGGVRREIDRECREKSGGRIAPLECRASCLILCMRAAADFYFVNEVMYKRISALCNCDDSFREGAAGALLNGLQGKT